MEISNQNIPRQVYTRQSIVYSLSNNRKHNLKMKQEKRLFTMNHSIIHSPALNKHVRTVSIPVIDTKGFIFNKTIEKLKSGENGSKTRLDKLPNANCFYETDCSLYSQNLKFCLLAGKKLIIARGKNNIMRNMEQMKVNEYREPQKRLKIKITIKCV